MLVLKVKLKANPKKIGKLDSNLQLDNKTRNIE